MYWLLDWCWIGDRFYYLVMLGKDDWLRHFDGFGWNWRNGNDENKLGGPVVVNEVDGPPVLSCEDERNFKVDVDKARLQDGRQFFSQTNLLNLVGRVVAQFVLVPLYFNNNFSVAGLAACHFDICVQSCADLARHKVPEDLSE